MSKNLKHGIIEDVDTVRRIPVGQLKIVDMVVSKEN